jgi:DNA mismatch repair protein MutH
MAAHKLDPIDRQILAELQADGRMTNVELASRVGISAPPCLRRVRGWRSKASSAAIMPTSTRESWGSRFRSLRWCG